MTDRILAIIKYFHLSPSDFAEEIGVQRSSISHLISGRNKPSLEFVQKILGRFPEINTDWLLNGNGEMLKQDNLSVDGEIPFKTVIERPVERHIEEPREQFKREAARIPLKKKTTEPDDRQVEKIIYLYKDKTFREYVPE
jgi:transcriptional regulator with XRE-family HTH domain